VAQIPNEVKSIFEEALNSFYETQLAYPIQSLASMFHVFPHLIDDSAKLILDFYKRLEKRDWDEKAKEAIERYIHRP